MSSWIKASNLHLVLAVIWVLLMVPTVTYWKDSVLWVGIISVYANVVSHWGAYQAARAEEKVA